MKVLWLNHRDIEHPRHGGAERTVLEIGRRLVAQGHEVQWVTAQWPGAPAESIVDGIVVRRFPGNPGAHLVVPWVVRGDPRPDVVVEDLAHVLPWGTPWVSRVPGTAFFHHLHARTLPGQVRGPAVPVLSAIERLYPRLYRTWPFVTESETALQDLEGLGVNPERCTRILPGVDLTRFVPGPKSEHPTVVYFGGFRRYKRADHVIRMLALLRGRGIPVTADLIGAGPTLGAVAGLARELGLEESVRFHGRTSDARLIELVRRSWLNVHCAVAEGWGFTVLEAAAAGVPTVAYRVPGVSEALANDRSGFLVPDGDPRALAEAAARVISDPHVWTRRSRELAERFSWDVAAEAWRAHLESVASGTKPS